MPGRIGANTWLWATIAAAAFGWALIAVVFAAIGPPAYVPTSSTMPTSNT